ncbi:MAG: NADH-quinone oxidoreductase subunit L [Alphaproteobacteria bacterium]|nr:NADH-quinone oxidoreductase subunit L [Alphaproteobacteria bacterium]
MYVAIVFLPLFASMLAGFFGRLLGDRGAQLITCGAVSLAALLSLYAFYDVAILGHTQKVQLFEWIDSGSFEVAWALRIDQLTAVMLVVVCGVSALVHIYSIGYMAEDPHIPRFMSYLSLFTFAMLMLVTADNLVQLFFGWEGVGLASYLLIGFWYERPSANAAAIKAFLVNRIGDFGFALGIFGVFLVFDSVAFDQVFKSAPGMAGRSFEFLGWQVDIMTTLCLLLFVGAMGKSAQVPLHTWLPDAMEGPTPVSALIHAATMVTAGVFLVARFSPMFEYAPNALAVVAVVGAFTAFFAGTIGLAQNDIKRVIAYSTCSQLGYMFFAAGVHAYGAAIFHLFTHAFFKALLFLSAGAVIHAMHHEQDMRIMGGLRHHLKRTYVLFWIGSLALAGLPFFAGYFSKDIILEAAWAVHTGVGNFAFVLGLAAAVLTAFYSWRLIFMTFHGQPGARAPGRAAHPHGHDTHGHGSHGEAHAIHEAPPVMMIPLYILALGAIFAGLAFSDYFVGAGREAFWGEAIKVLPENDSIEAAHHAPLWVKLAPVAAGLIGILAAWYGYIRRPGLPGELAHTHAEAYRFLLNKWYFDEIYEFFLVRPAKWLGRLLWKGGDGRIIDGFGPDGIAASVLDLARRTSLLQTGFVYHYAFAMLIGVAILVTWYFATGHGG